MSAFGGVGLSPTLPLLPIFSGVGVGVGSGSGSGLGFPSLTLGSYSPPSCFSGVGRGAPSGEATVILACGFSVLKSKRPRAISPQPSRAFNQSSNGVFSKPNCLLLISTTTNLPFSSRTAASCFHSFPSFALSFPL